MKTLLLFILKLTLSYTAIYGLGYFLTSEVNPMIWSTSAKIWFILFLLLTTYSNIEDL